MCACWPERARRITETRRQAYLSLSLVTVNDHASIDGYAARGMYGGPKVQHRMAITRYYPKKNDRVSRSCSSLNMSTDLPPS